MRSSGEATSSARAGNLKDLAALTTAALGVFTALAGGATVGGGFDRVARGAPDLVAGALGAFALATTSAALGTILASGGATRGGDRRGRSRFERTWLVLPMGLFLVGIALSTWAVVRTAGNRSRASIDAVVKVEAAGAASLELTVRATGLNPSEFARIKIERVSAGRVRPEEQPIYMATQGPQETGAVDFKLSVPLPAGTYDAVLVQVWNADKEPPCDPYSLGGGKDNHRFGCLTVAVRPSRA